MTRSIEVLLDEVRKTFHAAVQAADALHAAEPVTTAQRAVLEFLLRHETETVPGMARARHVSRQHIQTLVNGLLELEMVRLVPNPAHKRSPLVALTAAGTRQIKCMRRKEVKSLEAVEAQISDRRLGAAARTLRCVRAALGAER